MSAKQLKALAEQGDVEAQFRIVGCYKKGEEIKKDFAKAVEWYTTGSRFPFILSAYIVIDYISLFFSSLCQKMKLSKVIICQKSKKSKVIIPIDLMICLKNTL